jgi:hypothetical protein
MKYLILLSTFLLTGCSAMLGSVNYEAKGSPARCETEAYTMSITPADCWMRGCSAFELVVKNKLPTEISIDWDKTLWASGGTTNGRLVKAGTRMRDIGQAEASTVVFANSEFSGWVAPADRMKHFGGGLINDFRYGYGPDAMPAGRNGVYLTAKAQGKEYQCLAQYELVYTPK